MPTYEMVLLLPKMERTALKSVLKRSIQYIFEAGGTVRKLENLGFSQLPFKIKANRKCYTEAERFLIDFDANLNKRSVFMDKLKRDMDVIRATTFIQTYSVGDNLKEKVKEECTLHLDLLPPPFRPSVIKIQEAGGVKRKHDEKVVFKKNMEIDYYPF